MGSKAATSGTTFSKPSLKRLGVVRDSATFVATKSTGIASSLYSTARSYVPKSLVPTLSKLEDTVSSYSYPVLTQIQDRGDVILGQLDSSVDYVAKKADAVVGSSVSSIHKSGMQVYNARKEASKKAFDDFTQTLKSKGVAGTAKSAAESVKGQVGAAYKSTQSSIKYGKDKLFEAVEGVHHLPLVEKAIAEIQKVYGFALQKYMATHDAVLGTPLYHKAYKGSLDSISTVQGTSLYKTAKKQLYPSVAPYTDPALDKLQANSYYKAVAEHLKPVNGKVV